MCALLPILPRVPPLAVPCLGTPPGVSPLLEDADGVLSLHFYFLTARIPLAAAQVQHLGSPASGSDTPALFARVGESPCLMRVLRLPPPMQKPDYQPGERTQGPREHKQPETGTQAP